MFNGLFGLGRAFNTACAVRPSRLPPIQVQQRFAELVASQAELTQSPRLKIQNLRRTRGRLLPRLLAGREDMAT